ncbi:MAG: hypothetical protein HKN16_10655 [Saprospiraceae bacterium]|nr:hypothetical protein [Saprospiraceae bacterium]
MNRLKYFLFGIVALTMVACAGDEELPFVDFEDLGYGAYPRLIDGINGQYGVAYNFFDVPNSSIDFTVEFFDDNAGQNVASYAWDVSYSGGGEASLGTITSSSFGTSPAGLPSATVSFTFQEVLDALGYTIDDVIGGERFVFEGTVTKTDGSTFTSANTSGNIESTAGTFRGMFQIVVNIICPSELGGTYAAHTETPDWCGSTWDGEVVLVEDGPGSYIITANVAGGDDPNDFSMGAYDACYGPTSTKPGGNLRFQDACNKLSYAGASRWGEVYYFNSVTVDGADLTIDWYNDYAPESGVTTLTRGDGSDWPELFF